MCASLGARRPTRLPLPVTAHTLGGISFGPQRLRALDHGDVLTEAQKNAVVAKKIGRDEPPLSLPLR